MHSRNSSPNPPPPPTTPNSTPPRTVSSYPITTGDLRSTDPWTGGATTSDEPSPSPTHPWRDGWIGMGQTGIQVGNACWELYCPEHDIQLLACLSEPTSGSICIQKYDDNGKPMGLSEVLASQRVGIVFQFPERSS
ncbi:hypothetical protein ZWY2020_021267 [Hordeum vulgare]|nr:hypothetical protein ZWY2020_021267 [Hordeum vulgare]